MALEQHEKRKKAALVELWQKMYAPWRCEELYAPLRHEKRKKAALVELWEEMYAPWRPIVPLRDLKNGCEELYAPLRHEEMQKTAQMKRWTEDEISVHHEEMQKTTQMKRIEERWTEDEISVEHEEMQKTAQMKRMEERWTEDEISVHHEEMQKTAQMKRIEERWTDDEISVHRIPVVPWSIALPRVFKNGDKEMQKTAQMKRMEEQWTEDEISVDRIPVVPWSIAPPRDFKNEHEEMQKTAQMKSMKERWTEDEISVHRIPVEPWSIAPPRVFKNGRIPVVPWSIAPPRVLKNRCEQLDAIRRWEEMYAPRRPIVPLRDLKNGCEQLDAIRRHEEMQKIELMKLCEQLDAIRRRIARRRDNENGWEEMYAPRRPIVPLRDLKNGQMSDERGKKRCAKTISATAYLMGVNFSPYHSRKIQRGSFGLPFQSFSYFEGTGHENERHTMQQMSDERRKERGANKISANAEQTDVNFPDYSSKFKTGTFVLCSQFLPCAGGNDLKDSQQKQQTVNGIYQHTLRNVSHCPTSVSDYIQRAKDKCAEVCINNIQDDGCSYHCMRDSYKTSLVEFCAKPKLLFDYCPEYDSIGQTVQKDIYTPCKPSNPFERFYSSSDLFFCDQDKCLQLRDASVSTSVTSLMTDTTLVSGDLNESWLSQYWYVVWLLWLAVMLCLVLFRLRWRLMEIFWKCTKKGNPNNVVDENEQAALHDTA